MFDIIAEQLEKINFSFMPFPLEKENIFTIPIMDSFVNFINVFVDIASPKTKILETVSHLDINALDDKGIENIVNLSLLNEVHCLDNFLESANRKLPLKGTFICRVETKEQRYRKIFNKLPKFIFYPYYSIDFIINRIFPKWGLTRAIFSFFIKRNNRVLSLSHILGMFVFFGFKICYFKRY